MPLRAGVALTLGAAVASDLGGGEHPTRTLVLVIVAVVAAVVWSRLSGSAGLFSSVAGVVVLQPVLHGLGDLVGADRELEGTGVLHVLFSDGPAAGMQVAVSAAIVVAAAVLAHCTGLLRSVIDPARLLATAPIESHERVEAQIRTVPPRSRRHQRRSHAAPVSRRGPPACCR